MVPSTKFSATRLFAATADEVDSMRAGDIRKELESYGISTKSFFEKSELIDALKKARAEGKTPINNGAKAPSSGSSSSSDTTTSKSAGGGASREEKIKAEMEKIKSMKVLEMKKELNDLGVSTKSFFEKTEFVKALAEARVDGVKNRPGESRAGGRQEQEEEYDPSYRDVVMQKFNMDPRDPSMRGPLIDIRLGR